MSDFLFRFKSGDENAKWPWLGMLGATVVSMVVAGFIAYPKEAISLLTEGSLKIFAEKNGLGHSQDTNMRTCNAFIVFNCTVHNNSSLPATRVQTALQSVEHKLLPPIVAQSSPKEDDPSDGGAVHNKGFEKKPTSEKKKQAAPLESPITKQYRFVGPADDLTTLGLQPRPPSTGYCLLRPYESCYMPQGFGRGTVIRAED